MPEASLLEGVLSTFFARAVVPQISREICFEIRLNCITMGKRKQKKLVARRYYQFILNEEWLRDKKKIIASKAEWADRLISSMHPWPEDKLEELYQLAKQCAEEGALQNCTSCFVSLGQEKLDAFSSIHPLVKRLKSLTQKVLNLKK